jgi:hypothetical protein
MVQVLWLFARWRVCWKLQFWTDCSNERKIKSGAVCIRFFPWVEYQKVGRLSQLSISYLYRLIGPTVQKLRNFVHRRCCWILFLDRTAAKRIFGFDSRISWNSRCLKYHFHRQLSQISYGLLDGSKQLAICMLRQSKTQPVAESAFLGRLHLPVLIRFLANFPHDFPRNFIYKKCRQRTKLSVGYSYNLFQHTVWWLRNFEVRVQCWTDLDKLSKEVKSQV